MAYFIVKQNRIINSYSRLNRGSQQVQVWLWKDATFLWQLRIAILSVLATSRPDVTSGITCVVTGSRKQGVQASRELSGCSRAERLEAVAALCSHCWASCSFRVRASAGSPNFRPGGGLGKMVGFPVPVGGSQESPHTVSGSAGSGKV